MIAFWFRRDLRLEDNRGFFEALSIGKPVLPIFIFDKNILAKLDNKSDARVSFIEAELTLMQEQLVEKGKSLVVRYDIPLEAWKKILKQYPDIQGIYTNNDYEPYARERDSQVAALCKEHKITFKTFKDHVVFEEKEVVKNDGEPYTVFTPYSKKWKATLEDAPSTLRDYPSEELLDNCLDLSPQPIPSLADMGFVRTSIDIPSKIVARSVIKAYDKKRNFPSAEGTSRLGIHFRFGTISIRQKVKAAQSLNETYLNELIWRDFYAMILANFPYVASSPFRKKYEAIPWRNNEKEFEAWCQGKTGFPLVDAGMRQLNTTGYMHNRVRMLTASFLTKHLLINWQWGEAYFAEKLLDYDLASNNGGWQWAAGCGTDAAPYFRIFNPHTQLDKFDKNRTYVKKWLPEFDTADYPDPIVAHKAARERCLKVYKEALSG